MSNAKLMARWAAVHSLPFVRAKAGTQIFDLDSRFRGDERNFALGLAST
jgi:hypothetical protein